MSAVPRREIAKPQCHADDVVGRIHSDVREGRRGRPEQRLADLFRLHGALVEGLLVVGQLVDHVGDRLDVCGRGASDHRENLRPHASTSGGTL